MLTKSSIDAVFGTAQALANRNIALSAVENTPLSALVESSLQSVVSFSMLQFTGEDGKPLEGAKQPSFVDLLLHGSSNEPENLDGSLHDDVMDESVAIVHDAVDFIIRTARDVVNPKVGSIAAAVEAALKNHDKVSEQPVSVSSVYDPQFWKCESLLELIGRYTEARENPVRYTGPALAYNFDLVSTGLHSLDSDLKFFMNCDLSESMTVAAADSRAGESDAKGPTQIEQIWASTFGGGAFDTRDVLKGGRDVINTALVVFFTAMGLGDNPPEGTQTSASEWRVMCGELQAEAGRVAAQLMKRQITARRLKNMSIVWPLSHGAGSIIKVDGEVYSGFCQMGGSPEVIIGSYFSDKTTDFDKLLTNADHYRSVYMRTQSLFSVKAKADSLGVFINAINAGVTDVINNGLGGLTLPNTDKSQLHEKLKGQLGLLTSKDQDEIWLTVRRVLCRTVLDGTGVEQFLQDIDYHRNERPSLTVREAALLAACDALARWVAQLITVTAVRA